MHIEVIVRTGRESDDLERTEDAAQLRRLLLRQGVEEVRLHRDGSLPAGAKAGDGIVVGAMLVTLAPHALQAVVSAIQAWSARASGRSVEIVEDGRSLTASGLSEHEQRELIEDFRRRAAAADDGGVPDGGA
ncbi:hypothetical protein [Streptomyces sp. R41]|uniref:Resolvase/invertase-type recombinase catalytic domain-containing protein n=1 Tax=Streptomyces sp. R41 TaxID=3238632 RepID=A0AB39RHN3_9ACTN